MRIASQIKTPLRLIRWRMRRLRQGLRHGKMDAPIFFGNSFPKSGTHLLTQALNGFSALGPVVNSGLPPVVNFDGPTGEPVAVSVLVNQLSRYRPGDIGYGHLHAYDEVVDLFCSEGWAAYFIVRDPRDVVVSHVHYVTEMAPDHVHHDHYAHELKSFDERLRVSMVGRPELDIPFPGISERFRPYVSWLAHPEVLTLRFEEFILDKEAVLEKLLTHAVSRGFNYHGNPGEAVSVLGASIDPKRSPTFRSGKVGGWREQFSEDHKNLFKEVAGDLLVQLGYEQDLNW